MKFSVLLASAALGSASALSVDWLRALTPALNSTSGAVSNCGKAGALAKNFVFSIVPDAPKAGQEVVTTFDYDLDADLCTGYPATDLCKAKYSLTYNFIPISPTTESLCAGQVGTADPCPLKAGHHTDVSKQIWPSGLSGTVVSQIEWTDETSAQILCVKWTAKV